MLTEEQIQERRSYVTGSDASVILGVNPYESLVDMWRVKLGLQAPKDLSDNPRVRAGNYLEPVVKNMFEDVMGKSVITDLKDEKHFDGRLTDTGLIKSKSNAWMAANIDGYIPAENALLEIKTAAYPDGWGEQGEAIIPKHYLCQVAHYMAVVDVPYAYVAVLIGGWDFRYYVIDRSEALEKIIIEKEYEFYDKNMTGLEEPEPRNMDDVITLYRNRTVVDPVVAHPGIIKAISNLTRSKNLIKREKELEKQFKEEIALYMKQYQTLTDANKEVLATFKYNKDSDTFDKKSFTKKHPELYKEFLIKTPGARVLKLKGMSDD